MHINDQEPHRRWSAYTCCQIQTRIMPFDCLVHVARYLGLTRALLRWRWTMLTMIVIYTVNLIHPLIQEEMLASIDSDLKEQGLPTESVILKQNKKLTTRTREAPNLLSPHVMESGSLSLRGWWMSHVKWKMTEMKWTSTSRVRKVFSVACAVHRIVETYQHLSLNRSIPIKGIKFYVSSASWKMARPTVSMRRNYKAFYGARVFVVLSSGERKLLKLDFPPDSGKVMSKRAKFISPEGEQITSVTVMLGCFGYEGYVTFTDLAVKPIYDFELMRNQSIEPAQLLEPCQAPSRRPHEKSGDFLSEILYSASSPADYDAVTLVTQLTLNRINMLKTNLRFWNGPLSIAVYVLLEDVNNIELKKREVKKKLSTDIFRKYSTVSVVVIYGNKTGHQYPINRLRNIAIKNVKTKYIFMIDVDFVPSPDLERLARNEILHYNETRSSTDDKIAFVVPAFDGARHANIRDLPETKEELVKMLKRKNKLAPFRQIESPLSHSSTNYTKWYRANQSYEVSGYQDKYEPYLILRLTPELPLYDERFTGYGMNKISHVIELALLGYKFIVLPNVWIVHRYHVLSPLSLAHMTDPVSRFANRLQRFEFITDLYIQHKLGHCNNAKRQ